MSREEHPQGLTIGDAVAIAGIWISTSTITIMVGLIAFIWDPRVQATANRPPTEDEAAGALFGIVLMALPIIVAVWFTSRIIGRRQ